MASTGQLRLNRLERVSSLKERAYQSIKHCVLYELSSDDPLSVDELVNQLGISRTPVREALLALEVEGLVYSIPNRGTFVAAPTVEEVVEIYEVRAALESLAVRLAVARIPDDGLRALKAAFDAASEAMTEHGEFAPYFRSDVDFHEMIRTHAGNATLAQYIENLEDRLHRIRVHARKRSREHMVKAFREHQLVLDALIERDGPKAERRMKAHLTNSAKRIEAILRSEAKA